MKTLNNFNVNDKRILVRCDFNVPLDEHGNVADDFRIKKTLPTIQYLLDHNAKVILMSHLGEPGGKIVPSLTLKKIKTNIESLLKKKVKYAPDCIGEKTRVQSISLQSRQVLLLENLRFHSGEIENDVEFAKALSALGDIYINDAFSVCHRSHASVVSVPSYLPHGMGLLLEKEITTLEKVLKNPARPMVAIVGGTKVETKAAFIKNILRVADTVIVSGLIKKELSEKKLTFAQAEKMIAPMDTLDALDISDSTIQRFKEKIMPAKTILWNGPFGKFEDDHFKKGTLAIANAIIESKAFSIVGGGETVEFLSKEGISAKFSHVSTGGGAMLQFLSGDSLPGIEALK